MTRRLAINTAIVALALSLAAAVGCDKTRTCKKGTAFLDLRFAAPAQKGDRVDLTIDVTDMPHETVTGTLLLQEGTHGGTAEVDFQMPYRAGAHVIVLARAMRGDNMVEEIMTAATLADACSRIVLQNQMSTSPDAASDVPQGGGGGDDGGSTVSDGGAVDRPYVEVGGSCTGGCTPGETATCGRCGTKTCGADCSWSACTGESECLAGSMQACGNCGIQVCDTTCHWQATCQREGECKAGDSAVCGNCGRKTCSSTCAWSACAGDGTCTPGMTRTCGRCGTETCGNSGASCGWSGVCAGEGACSPGSTRPCGPGNCGTEACGTNCQWAGVCQNAGECAPGDVSGCGNCGTRTCGTDCHWPTAASACTGQGPCAPNTTAGCGNCGTVTCTAACQWSGTCAGQGACAPGDTIDCGACGNGLQTCTSACAWGVCKGGTTAGCCLAPLTSDPDLQALPVCP
jgi:hypothetical protein